MSELRELSGTDASLLSDPEVLEMIMPAIRSDYRAIEGYRHDPGRRLQTPITAVTGDRDPNVTIDEAKGWSEHTAGDFDLRVLPGGHFYLVPEIVAVLDLIREQLVPDLAGGA